MNIDTEILLKNIYHNENPITEYAVFEEIHKFIPYESCMRGVTFYFFTEDESYVEKHLNKIIEEAKKYGLRSVVHVERPKFDSNGKVFASIKRFENL